MNSTGPLVADTITSGARVLSYKIPASPVLYKPSMETGEKDSGQTAMTALSQTVFRINERAVVAGTDGPTPHDKSHGVLFGEMMVHDDLPDIMKQGIFQPGETYPVVMRLSSPEDERAATAKGPLRGLAVKIMDVPGERLPESEGQDTQDFILVNTPALMTPEAKRFLRNMNIFARHGNRPGLLNALSRVMGGIDKQEAGDVIAAGQEKDAVHTFYTQTASLYGPYIAKLSIIPLCRPDEQAATPENGTIKYYQTKGCNWDVRIQLCTDLEKMPVNNASVIWPEHESPFISVAHIIVPPQDSWDENNSKDIDLELSFNRWQGVTDHRPLGGVPPSAPSAETSEPASKAAKNA